MLVGNVLGCGGETVEIGGGVRTESGHLGESNVVVKETARDP